MLTLTTLTTLMIATMGIIGDYGIVDVLIRDADALVSNLGLLVEI